MERLTPSAGQGRGRLAHRLDERKLLRDDGPRSKGANHPGSLRAKMGRCTCARHVYVAIGVLLGEIDGGQNNQKEHPCMWLSSEEVLPSPAPQAEAMPRSPPRPSHDFPKQVFPVLVRGSVDSTRPRGARYSCYRIPTCLCYTHFYAHCVFSSNTCLLTFTNTCEQGKTDDPGPLMHCHQDPNESLPRLLKLGEVLGGEGVDQHRGSAHLKNKPALTPSKCAHRLWAAKYRCQVKDKALPRVDG